jgi:hypothetical protein
VTAATDTSRAHTRAIYDLLGPLTELPTEYQRFFAKVNVPDSKLKYPHLIVWATPGVSTMLNFTGTLSARYTVTQITAVGRDEDEVLAALDRADGLLQGVRPNIPGRFPGLIGNIPSGQAITPNETLRTYPDGAPTYRGIALYELQSTPAPVT